MGFQRRQSDDSDEFAPLSEINVTPFIDVMLVLLIIFMVTAPLLATGMNVQLPAIKSATQIENRKPVSITITAAGEIQVGSDLTSIGDLVSKVRAELAGEDRIIQIRGDENARYMRVIEVLDALSSSGLNRISFMSDRKRMPEAPHR